MEYMKKVKIKPKYNGLEFDSPEEIEFYQWLEEAKEEGMIVNFRPHPENFELIPPASFYERVQLSTKTKIIKRSLMQDCCYVPDFVFTATPELQRVNHRLFSPNNLEYWIDVKGKHSIYNDEEKFSIIQKLLWLRHGIYSNKVVPVKFFERTFVPRRAALTPVKKDLKSCYVHCRKIYNVPRELRFVNPDIVPAPDISPAVEQDLFQPKPGWSF
jgi:hypothetical protein